VTLIKLFPVLWQYVLRHGDILRTIPQNLGVSAYAAQRRKHAVRHIPELVTMKDGIAISDYSPRNPGFADSGIRSKERISDQ
jgi:hypothetical protein